MQFLTELTCRHSCAYTGTDPRTNCCAYFKEASREISIWKEVSRGGLEVDCPNSPQIENNQEMALILCYRSYWGRTFAIFWWMFSKYLSIFFIKLAFVSEINDARSLQALPILILVPWPCQGCGVVDSFGSSNTLPMTPLLLPCSVAISDALGPPVVNDEDNGGDATESAFCAERPR